ncbi:MULTISPECIES: KTSC domain-containing protein [unclassified Sphingomonas]|uniref:KTSC domain-containing protein n=1 Tax=unclassified Sphingomonas TaxID=196159 RepID=UPI000AC3A797|nr:MULTISPECIES: KTSC domain-containing protein [unclassified Sphingomonas]
MRFLRMPSSVIRSFDYDAPAQRLDVEFVTGRCYSYHDVPARIVAAMRAARSKGQFFNARIRDHFRFTRDR